MKNNRSIYLVILLLVITLLLLFTIRERPVKWTENNALVRTGLKVYGDTGDAEDLVKAVEQSILYYSRTGKDEKFYFGDRWCTSEDLTECLTDFLKKLKHLGLTPAFFKYINTEYLFFRTATRDLLLTGYFEPTLEGSRTRNEKFRYPVYKKPDDLVTIELTQFPLFQTWEGLPKVLKGKIDRENRITPYYSREEIDTLGSLSGKNNELLWVNDRIRLFFLHIQGSGMVRLTDGPSLRINYADTNGHPYRAIGRLLVEKNVCAPEELSMQRIEKYLRDNPDEIESTLNFNPSYIFFREVDEGPKGSLGVTVTPFRSIATDRYLFPRGAICYMETRIPEFDPEGMITGFREFRGFMMNQDTGGAIRTPARADLFTGNGRESEFIAGHLKESASLFFLIRKGMLKNL